MTTPLSKDEIQTFTPASLRNCEGAPVFRFRPATPRSVRAFQSAALIEGLAHHDVDAVRREQIAALHALNDAEEAQKLEDWLKGLWDMADQGMTLPEEDAKAADRLVESLMRNHRRLRVMLADNQRFFDDAPRLALGQFLVGWDSFDLPFRRVDGDVPLDYIDQIEAKLEEFEKANEGKVEGVKPGTAYIELANYVLDQMTLTKAEEGKSPSLSQSSTTPNGSTTPGPETANGSSPAEPTETTPPTA